LGIVAESYVGNEAGTASLATAHCHYLILYPTENILAYENSFRNKIDYVVCHTEYKVQKALLCIVGLVVGLMMAGQILPDIITDVASESYSEPFSVATGVGVTNTTQTLTYDHYYTDLTGLTASSDNVSDTPVVMAYNEDTKLTTVAGLAASDSRILTINYVREARQQFTGFSAFLRILPFIMIAGLLFATLWGLFSAWQSRG